MFLPHDCERILKFLISSGSEAVDVNFIFALLDNETSRKDAIFAIEKLKAEGLVNAYVSDNFEVGRIALTSSGRYYFEEKEIDSSQRSQKITINNSSGFNIGNNNSVSIHNGASFDEVRQLISENNLNDKEVLLEIVDVLQDCIEKSKPLPKGRFQGFFDSASSFLPVVTSIGKLVLDYLCR